MLVTCGVKIYGNLAPVCVCFNYYRSCSHRFFKTCILSVILGDSIEYGVFGEGSQIATNQNQESTVFSLLIG